MLPREEAQEEKVRHLMPRMLGPFGNRWRGCGLLSCNKLELCVLVRLASGELNSR